MGTLPRRHNYGVVTLSVVDTSLAVLGQDNRVSLWSVGVPRHPLELPTITCHYSIPGPGDSSLVTGMDTIIVTMCHIIVHCRQDMVQHAGVLAAEAGLY